jgi:hypothetical protein
VKEIDDDQDKTREQELIDKMRTEKNYYKLADYFITIGLDNYYAPEEVYKHDDAKKESAFEMTMPSSMDQDPQNAAIDPQR